MRGPALRSDPRRRDLELSLALLAAVIAIALIGLATDGNWPKLARVGLSFLAYAAVLLLWLRRGRLPDSPRVLPFHGFAAAGAAAGLVSGVVRARIDVGMLVAGILGAALLLGGVHWLALGYWRRVRSAVTRR